MLVRVCLIMSTVCLKKHGTECGFICDVRSVSMYFMVSKYEVTSHAPRVFSSSSGVVSSNLFSSCSGCPSGGLSQRVCEIRQHMETTASFHVRLLGF